MGDAAQINGAEVSDCVNQKMMPFALGLSLRSPDKKTSYKKLNYFIISFSHCEHLQNFTLLFVNITHVP